MGVAEKKEIYPAQNIGVTYTIFLKNMKLIRKLFLL